MSAAKPQTIAADLHDRLSAITLNTRQVDEFGLARLRRDAEKLMAADPVEAHTLLGAAAALQFRDDEMDQHHRTAIRLNPTAMTHDNNAISLQIAQRREDAAAEAVIAADLDPLNHDYLFRAIRYLGVVGLLEDAMQRIELFHQRFPTLSLDDGADIPLANDILARHGVPLEELRVCQREAFALLRERQLRPSAICIEASGGDADEMVSYTISLDQPIETVMALDAELGERLFTAWPALHLNRFWLGFERKHAA